MLKERFRKFLPVVVDLETGGFNPKNNAILEIAIQLIDEKDSKLILGESHRFHIKPFEGLIVDANALEFLKLDLNHPLRMAVDEKFALGEIFKIIKSLGKKPAFVKKGYEYLYDEIKMLGKVGKTFSDRNRTTSINSLVSSGYDVAIFFPFKSSIPV